MVVMVESFTQEFENTKDGMRRAAPLRPSVTISACVPSSVANFVGPHSENGVNASALVIGKPP
jgi:hypothetical protein